LTDTQKASNLLSFPTRIEEPAYRSSKCPACNKLEYEYQCAIHEIFSVVRTRFPTLREKLQELHKWQDIRDGAVKVFYKHKASHIRRTA
jgi:type II secretory ATPase GspE/PulE/Tfp pilus assembly ATPase PilB-like protein